MVVFCNRAVCISVMLMVMGFFLESVCISVMFVCLSVMFVYISVIILVYIQVSVISVTVVYIYVCVYIYVLLCLDAYNFWKKFSYWILLSRLICYSAGAFFVLSVIFF